jgi:hypothetical protein
LAAAQFGTNRKRLPTQLYVRAQMDQLMISLLFTLYFLAGFTMQVLAVVVGLWIWNRYPALATLARRTSA